MSGHEIEILNDAEVQIPTEQRLREAAVATLVRQQVTPPAALTIWLTDDDQLKRLNSQFRGEAKPTDVLSFPSGDLAEQPGCYLGDIAISIPMADRQAARAGHDRDAELTLLTVHGVLHLLGHDHAEPEQRANMWSVQADVLKHLGLDSERLLAQIDGNADAN